MAHMRQGGTGDNLPRPIVGGRRAVCHARAAAADSLGRLARLGGETRLKGKIVSAGRYGVSRPAGTISFVLMIIHLARSDSAVSAPQWRPFAAASFSAATAR